MARLVGEYEAIHHDRPYGATGHNSLPCLLPHLLALKPRSLIDYGSGQSDLAERLAKKANISTIRKYEPAIALLAIRPTEVFDVLISVDVFEHIPIEEIDHVAADMAAMGRDALLVIDTAAAGMRLSDGRNAHVSLHDQDWWLARLSLAWPTLRPIAAHRPHRIAFKTWDIALPAPHHWRLTQRELLFRRARRLFKRSRRRPW